MLVGNTEIGRESMPSYEDFSKNPTHLYQLKQERLQQLLQVQMQPPQQPAPVANPATQSQRWNNEQ